jgi:hypothetical protein
MADIFLDKKEQKSSVNFGTNNIGGVGIQLPNRFSKQSASKPSPDFSIDENFDDIMKDIANPSKTKSDDEISSDDNSLDIDYDGDGQYSSPEESPQQHRRETRYYDEERPSTGFLTIADEKADILFRLEVLRKQGIEPRRFSARDDIMEMRAELTRIKTHLELERSLKFSRKAVVGLSAALEFLNDKVDVLDLELDGWSEQMHQAVYTQKEYDSIFEELFFKYRGKIQTPPEIRLLLAIGTSALTFHMSNVMIKKMKMTADNDQNGMEEFMAKMIGTQQPAQQLQPQLVIPPQTTSVRQSPNVSDFFQNGLRDKIVENAPRREMKPPSFEFPVGLSSNAVQHVTNPFAPMQSRTTDVKETKHFKSNLDMPDDESDRFSDVPSDIGPLSPIQSISTEDGKVIDVELDSQSGKTKRKYTKKNKPATKTIIEI